MFVLNNIFYLNTNIYKLLLNNQEYFLNNIYASIKKDDTKKKALLKIIIFCYYLFLSKINYMLKIINFKLYFK